MLQIYPYQCECGWNTEYITGGFRRRVSLAERVERQLINATNLDARAHWRELYQRAIKEELVYEDTKVREGYVSCFHCKNSHSQIALYDSNGQLLHPIICHQCGRDGHFSLPSGPAVCPLCESTVATGDDVFSIEEQILRLLKTCQVSSPTITSEPLLLIIGERSNKYLTPFLTDIPYLSIQKGEQGNREIDVMDMLSNRKRVFLHTYFETPLASRLTLLLAKQLFSMNIELIPILVTPPTFEGKRRNEQVMGYIQELQSYCKHSVLVSSTTSIKFDRVMELFEQHIPNQVMAAIHRYSIEKEATTE